MDKEANNRVPLFAANWKMNKRVSETSDFITQLSELLIDAPAKLGADYEVLICPPSTHLPAFQSALEDQRIFHGGQNCGIAKSGAYTGEISPVVLRELGCRWVIIGHSERRHVFKEDNTMVLARTKAALEEGLSVVLCVGEVLQDRKADKTFKVVDEQLSILKESQIDSNSLNRIVVAYEPVWAIGTGETATPAQAQEVHQYIREWFSKNCSASLAPQLRILYGGSVKPENATQLMNESDVDGFLVGGASLDPTAFSNVIKNGLKSRVTGAKK